MFGISFENFYEPWGAGFTTAAFRAQAAAWRSIFQDITERKRTNQALRKSEERFWLFRRLP
jgi:PAS domain-containing protein